MKKISLYLLGFLLSLVSCSKEDVTQVATNNPIVVEKVVTPKKGVGLTESTFGNAQLSSLNVSWYYSWGYTTDLINPPAQFIPMVFSLNTFPNVTSQPTILGFNEPDNSSQSNMSVATAIANWSTLVNNSTDRNSTRLNSSHVSESRMPSSA